MGGFDHKNVPAVPSIYPGFAQRKVKIPLIPRPHRAVVTNDWCITPMYHNFSMNKAIKYELGHEKMCLMSYANNKGTDQPAHSRSLISAFVVRCLDSIKSLDSIAKIAKLLLASVAAQTFVSGLSGNSRRHILSCHGSYIF